MRAREVEAAGERIGVLESGPGDGPPLVLVHGWAQAADSWAAQLDGALSERYRVVAVDLRGHGRSSIPAGGYADPATWADELHAVLAGLGAPVVLAGWSYGGLVIADYLRTRGTQALAGVAFVGAITELGRGRKGGRVGPAMRAALPDVLSEDPAVAVPAATAFVTGMADGVPGEWAQRALGNLLRVPPRVRAALFDRTADSADVLATVTVPALVLHGTADAVVDVSAGEFAAATLPGARTHWMPGVGHAPFVERPDEFDRVLGGFAADCFADSAAQSVTGDAAGNFAAGGSGGVR